MITKVYLLDNINNMFGLEDSWNAMAKKQEEGEDFEDSDFKAPSAVDGANISASEKITDVLTFRQMQKIASENPDMQDLLNDIIRSLLRYIKAVDSLTLAVVSSGNEEEGKENFKSIGEFDKNRRTAHETLIDSLNIMSRACHKRGIDNTWRSVIGLDRKQVTTWAQAVYPIITKEIQNN